MEVFCVIVVIVFGIIDYINTMEAAKNETRNSKDLG